MSYASYLRLVTSLSRNRLQLITSYQINKHDCYNWGIHLTNNNELLSKIPIVEPILNRLISEPDFMVEIIRHNSIITCTINLTSSLEYFLNDTLSSYMISNSSLLKKGLKDIQVNSFDLVDFNELEKIRHKYISIIAQEKCKGELWSKKLKRVCSFLDISNKYYSNKINNTIDSIWEMRNNIAHGNQSKLFFYDNDVYLEHTENSNEKTYIDFILHFINATEKLEKLMEDLEKEASKNG